MRVIAGRAKGHRLRAPKGMFTRPTSDKVREAIFAMLQQGFAGEAVLDLFAGTGALGIEALSRGAASAVFVERRPHVCRVIQGNLEHTNFSNSGRVMCMAAERSLTMLTEAFGLVLLDPPYAEPRLHDIMATVAGAGCVVRGTVVVFEHSPRFVPDIAYGRLVQQRQRTYGDTAVAIYEAGEERLA